MFRCEVYNPMFEYESGYKRHINKKNPCVSKSKSNTITKCEFCENEYMSKKVLFQNI